MILRNFIMSGFLFTCIFMLSPIDTIIHENLHCSGCYIIYPDCKCNITYRFFNFESPSYAKYNYNIKENNCKMYSIGEKFDNILISLLPYMAYPLYIFVFSIINIYNFKYRKFTFLFIFINGIILLFSIASYLLLPGYEVINDFKSVTKYLSITNTYLLIINIVYLPSLSIIIYSLISLYKLHKLFDYVYNINELKDFNHCLYNNINNINNLNKLNLLQNYNKNDIINNLNKSKSICFYYINNINSIKHFQKYVKIDDFIKSYNIISIFHLFKLFKIGLYFYVIITSQCYLTNEKNTTITEGINLNLNVYYLFNVCNIIFDLLLIIIIYIIANKKIKLFTLIVMPLTNLLYFIIDWKYYILINTINSIFFVIYYLNNI